jgi:hypothetical protein
MKRRHTTAREVSAQAMRAVKTFVVGESADPRAAFASNAARAPSSPHAADAGSSANADIGGHAQNRLRSP